MRWLAFPHDLASVPLADVECYTRRVFIHFLARDDIVVMVVAAVPSSIGVFLGLVPASFGSCVVDRATNRSFEQIYGRLAHEREVGVVAAVAGQFNLVYRTNREFCSASEDGKRVLSSLFRMSLNESCYVLSELSRVCRRNGSSDDRFDKCDVFHNSSDALVSKNRTFVRNILLENFSVFHLKPPGGVLIEYPYVYIIYTISICIHDIL